MIVVKAKWKGYILYGTVDNFDSPTKAATTSYETAMKFS